MILASNYIMLSGTYEIQLKIDAVGKICILPKMWYSNVCHGKKL